MRFNAQGPQNEAKLLKEKLAEENIHLNIIDVKPGQNITKIVFETMVQCDAFIAMATKDYGARVVLAARARLLLLACCADGAQARAQATPQRRIVSCTSGSRR